MPFKLKNAEATFQQLVNKMFSNFLRETIDIYIDDMLVKSLCVVDHVQHLRQAFNVLDSYQMKLNPKKCTFEVSSGEFFGYLVT